MAPLPQHSSIPNILVPGPGNITGPIDVSAHLAAQWTNPSDILSILLLVGPDIVQRAVAQLTGRVVTPAAFSFGWVAYATSALVQAFGDGHLLPVSDMPNTLVVGAESGHSRATRSWVLGRLLRDAQARVHAEVQREKACAPLQGDKTRSSSVDKSHPSWDALRVNVYEFDDHPPVPHGHPTLDRVWYSGFAVIAAQLAIALIPWMIDRDWVPSLVTTTGNILALLGASLPQWKAEKWACPDSGSPTITLTQGNGSRFAMLILGRKGVGLNFEILATAGDTLRPSPSTRVLSGVLALAWIMLLVTVAGLQQNTWYLLGIGLIGSIHNLYAAGAPRDPSAMGIHLKEVVTFRGKKVAHVLKQLEERYPLVGTSLVDVFFPGSLRVTTDEDFAFWRKAIRSRYTPNKHGRRIDYEAATDITMADEFEDMKVLSISEVKALF